MINWVVLLRRRFQKIPVHIGVLGLFLLFSCSQVQEQKPHVFGHLWVYASQYPPDWNSNPVMEKIFMDFSYAGLDGIEIMDANLRDPNIVSILKPLIQKYNIPVIGASYYGDMWNIDQEVAILKDATIVIERLSEVGGKYLGITVGDAGRKKTEAELDQQAKILKLVIEICERNQITPNLHNHTFEMDFEQHDFLGTIQRVPEIKLGPDINWLIRAGVDPIKFLEIHGEKIIFLHLRDQDQDGLWTHYLGQGDTDFEAISNTLDQIGFTGDIAIELAYEEQPEHPIREDFKKSREFVKKTFGW